MRWRWVVAAGLLVGGAAGAEEAPPTPEDIIVFGRGAPLIGVAEAGSEGIVGYRDFELRPMLRAGELLETIPGVIATQHSGEGKANQYYLRGFNLDHGTDFAGYADMAPVNMRSHGHGQGYMDLNFIIPELTQRIDYRKGPYYPDIGDFTAAGTARYVTYDRLDQPFADLTLGEYGYVRGVVAGSADVGGGSLLAGGLAATGDGPWVLPQGMQQFSGLAKFTKGDGEAEWSVQAGGYTASWTATDQVPLRAIEDGTIDRLGYIDPDLGGRTTRLWLGGQFAANGWAGTAYLIDYRLNLTSNFTYFLEDPVGGDEFEQADDRTVYGGTLAKTWRTTLGRVPVALTLGSELRYDDIGTVGLFHSQGGVRTGTVRQDSVDEFSVAGWAQGAFDLSPTFRAILALRGDHYGYRVRSSIAENSGSGTDGFISPKVSLAWRVAEPVELYANWGRGFHSNDARGAAITLDPNTLEPADAVPLLVAAQGAELGARYQRGRFNATFVGFWLHLDSELVFTGDGGTTEPNPASRRYGIEFAGFWRPVDTVAFDLSAAWTDARFIGFAEGDRIPGAVTAVVAAGVTWDFAPGFTATLRMRHFGAAPLIEDGSVWSEPTTLFNLGGYWTVGRLRLGLDIYNLFDAKDADITYWYASRLPGEPAEGVEDYHIHPVEPRQVRGTIRVTF